MKETYLTMIEADEGMVLTDGINYCSSVLLRKGETSEGWSEITQEEYDELFPSEEEQ
jgi:hypothetical protein